MTSAAADDLCPEMSLHHVTRCTQCGGTIAFEGRPMHRRQQPRFEERQRFEPIARLRREWHVIHENGVRLHHRDRIAVAPHDVFASQRFAHAELME